MKKQPDRAEPCPYEQNGKVAASVAAGTMDRGE